MVESFLPVVLCPQESMDRSVAADPAPKNYYPRTRNHSPHFPTFFEIDARSQLHRATYAVPDGVQPLSLRSPSSRPVGAKCHVLPAGPRFRESKREDGNKAVLHLLFVNGMPSL